eukprot:748586-Hanusia_phi.AAC.2
MFEPHVMHFLDVKCREEFIRTLFQRIFVLVDTLKSVRQLILQVCASARPSRACSQVLLVKCL